MQNEAFEMASRYVRFDVGELTRIATEAVGAKSCIRVEKLVDGMHNKALLLVMENGKEVVAKMPYPVAGKPHFTTASEVATMNIMRTFLDTPVPKVYAWCSHAAETSVGAEYIIMEKAAGVPLTSVWQKLRLSDRFAVTKAISRHQAAWSTACYEGYGSIYYASDLTGEHNLPLGNLAGNGRFALGPITGRDWNDDGRQPVDFDRGPCKSALARRILPRLTCRLGRTLEEYLEAVGRREATCVKELPQLPPPQITLCGPGTYQSTREKKIQALDYYLQLSKHIAPSDPTIRKPSAWHGDLHLENIFVDPAEPTKVTSIIDWQSTEVAPLFVQARQPYILDYEGPQAIGLDRPCLPANFAELSPEAQKTANRVLLGQALCVAYKRWTQSRAPDIWNCFEFQETPAFQLLQLAQFLLVDGEAFYTARIIEHLRSSDNVLKGSGLSIPEHVMARAEAETEGAIRGVEAMTMIQDTIGDLFPERGCVRSEQYDEAKDALRQCKEQIIDMFASTEAERAAWEESWPFDN